MRIQLRHNLPFVTVRVTYRGLSVDVPDVLVDTGSGGTILSADALEPIGVSLESNEVLDSLRGVGGREYVFKRVVDRLEVEGHGLDRFRIEVGGMDYGFAISGILGMNFLVPLGAIIDLQEQELEFAAG